ncbi:hypothetical protein [Sphingomonas oligoaromativorans]|uniref:hypothetical protein n=1 Tax=Sphingomonas oligoaromativorans TaxID=575322 RepID=UPI0014235E37|nr:hypothetical protein [Sphingomonas oligoaromativorans]NIJ32802.1 hypothetical protein [Sphingomonas oligoaromativorans]
MTRTIANKARSATELLLKSMFWGSRADDSGLTSASAFHVVRPHIGAGFYYAAEALLDAVLFIRRHASSHLRSLPIEDLQSMLLAFIDEQFDGLRFAWWQIPEDRPFLGHLPAKEIERLAAAMMESPIFVAPRMLFLFPLAIAETAAPFRSESFFLLPPEELGAELTEWYETDELKPYHHPPVPMHSTMPLVKTSCWLGVRAPVSTTALRMRNVIMGALSLLPHPLERYLFSMRTVPTGYSSFERRATYHSGDASSPSLSEDLVIANGDHGWLRTLAAKLGSNETNDRKALLALQYFFRAWVKDPAARVAPLCGAIEALRKGQDKSGEQFIEAMASLGPAFEKRRVTDLLEIRGAVIHGGAPNVYEVSAYQDYWAAYRCDPIRDLELVAARYLQRAIFGPAFAQRPHTYADLIRQHTGANV